MMPFWTDYSLFQWLPAVVAGVSAVIAQLFLVGGR
jgi:hypothetical protein